MGTELQANLPVQLHVILDLVTRRFQQTDLVGADLDPAGRIQAGSFFTSVERLYSGFAKLPRGAPWLDDLRHELISFPAGRIDD